MKQVLLAVAVFSTVALAKPRPQDSDGIPPIPELPTAEGRRVRSAIYDFSSLLVGENQHIESQKRTRRQSESALFRPSSGESREYSPSSRDGEYQGTSGSGRRDQPSKGSTSSPYTSYPRETRPSYPKYGREDTVLHREGDKEHHIETPHKGSNDEHYLAEHFETDHHDNKHPLKEVYGHHGSDHHEPSLHKEHHYEGEHHGYKPVKEHHEEEHHESPLHKERPYEGEHHGYNPVKEYHGSDHHRESSLHKEHAYESEHHGYKPVKEHHGSEHHESPIHKEQKHHGYIPGKEHHGSDYHHESSLHKERPYESEHHGYKPVKEHHGSEHHESPIQKEHENHGYKPDKEHHGSDYHHESSLHKEHAYESEHHGYKPVKEHHGSEHHESPIQKEHEHHGYIPGKEHHGSDYHHESSLHKEHPYESEHHGYRPDKEHHGSDHHEYMNKRPSSYGSGVSSHNPNLYEKPPHVLHTVINDKPVVPLKSH